MLQQAYKEGFNPIYLVGCDLGFEGRASGADDQDHFSPDYNRRYASEARAQVDEETHIELHTQAYCFLASRSVEIYNATVGGQLEVYPRVVYEELFT